MGKMILVTGGARSGKSLFAEQKANEAGTNVLYVATSVPFDDEMKLRVKKHKEQRPSHWETVEAYKDMDACLKGRLAGKSAVLLDCITIMISNIMFEKETDFETVTPDKIENIECTIKEEMDKLIMIALDSPVPFILVTNELGMGIVPENALTRMFRDIAGRANQMLAKAADEVYLCICGIPVRIK